MRTNPPFPVPRSIAELRRPTPPSDSSPFSVWKSYFQELAWWNAMRAEVIRYGVVEDLREKELNETKEKQRDS